ncbi:tetratricopeptide repeat protein [Candidatus Odyssella thessalonicensis]|uniref:tetratricopeptide repeat protein n=1 Tax=Candidatus Odyssella thessalonicensis TaxID=84647 RepID=UPI000225BFC5|nr:tetratricopeptide repeat protein [Candidatus Odyssella thessalonicensis]
MLKKIYKIILWLLFTLILSVLFGSGMIFTQYYEFYASDLVNPEKSIWLLGMPLFKAIFSLLFVLSVLGALIIKLLPKNKLSIIKLLFGSSLVFFTCGVLANFNGTHYKRLLNLRAYMDTINKMPSYQRTISLEKLVGIHFMVMAAIRAKIETLENKYLPYNLAEDFIDVLKGNRKLENREAYDPFIMLIKANLEKIKACRQDYIAYMSNFLSLDAFEKYIHNFPAFHRLSSKIPPHALYGVILYYMFPLVERHMSSKLITFLTLLDKIYELNENYLYLTNLVKENFINYTVYEDNGPIVSEIVATEYHRRIEKIEMLEAEIDNLYEAMKEEEQEKRETNISKHITEWSLPGNYLTLLENAGKGDSNAQEEMCAFLYKGILRFPDNTKEADQLLFDWLKDEHLQHSFQRKVARLFYMRGHVADAEEIYEAIQALAEQEDIDALRLMGNCYFYTDAIGSQDPTIALNWYKKAADKGHARAQLSLAIRHFDGMDVEKNIEESLRLLNQAAEAGLPEAQRHLGELCLIAKVIPLDIFKGFKLLTLAAKGGDASAKSILAQYHLGILNLPFPINKDVDKGLELLEDACRSLDTEAMYFYGLQLYEGKHLPLDQKKGLTVIKQAAKLGYKEAKRFLETVEKSKSLFLKDTPNSKSKDKPKGPISEAMERKDKSLHYYKSLNS